MKVKPYTWVARFDVAPTWVADGFNLDDERALGMLAKSIGFAHIGTELAASVLVAPTKTRIAKEQGYARDHPRRAQEVRDIASGSPNAYAYQTVERAISRAVTYLDQFHGEKGRQHASELRLALSLLNGTTPISDIEWARVLD